MRKRGRKGGGGTLRIVAVAAALALAAPARADPIEQWRSHITEASVRFGVPAEWISQVMEAESGGRTTLHGRPITSRAGAMGLMQLMPGTWAEMREAHGLGTDPHDPRDNILAGTAYLRRMYDRFGYPGLFAAYNAGPTRYAGHLASGRSLPHETTHYLARVSPGASAAPTAAARLPNSIFFVLDSTPATSTSESETNSHHALFAIRATPRTGSE